MENSTNPIVPATPPAAPPENQENKPGISKSVIISILAVVIIGGSFMFFGSGNQYQGLIRARGENARIAEKPVEQPVPRGVIPRGKRTTTTNVTPSIDEEATKVAADAEAKKKADEEAAKTAETKAAEEAEAAKTNVTPIFDVSTMDIIHTPNYKKGTQTTMYFNHKATAEDIQYKNFNKFKLIFPTYNSNNTNPAEKKYSQTVNLQLCKTDLQQCLDVSSGIYDILKVPTITTKSTEILLYDDKIVEAVNTLGLSNNDQIVVRYKIVDPAVGDIFSKTLSLQIAKKEFDASALDISRILIYDQKDINTIYYNHKVQTNATSIDFNITPPKWKNGIPQTLSYSPGIVIQLCTLNLENCTKIGEGWIKLDQDLNKIIGASGKSITEAVNQLGIKHGEQGAIRYTVQDPGETVYESKSLTFTFADDTKPKEIKLTEGKTLFNLNSMGIQYVEMIDLGGAKTSLGPIKFDSRVKGITMLDFVIPNFSQKEYPQAELNYKQPVYLKLCNEGLTTCKTINEMQVTIGNDEGKTEGDVVGYQKTKYSTIDSEKMKSLLKELMPSYNGKFFFIYTTTDPTGIELTTPNSIEMIVDDYDKAAALAGPITGDIIDETTFKVINITNILGDDDLTVDYQLPNLKPSFDLTDQHLVSVTLEYCKPDFSSCVDVKKENTVTVYKKYDYADSPGLRYRSIFVDKTDKATIKNANPDKSLYRLKMESHENSTIYAVQ